MNVTNKKSKAEKAYSTGKLYFTIKALRALRAGKSCGFTVDQIFEFLEFTENPQNDVRTFEEDMYKFIAEKRDDIIFGEGYCPELYRGGVRYFENLRLSQLRRLMNAKLFDPYPWPRYMEYVWFMNTGGSVKEMYCTDKKLFLHGHVYSPERKRDWGRQFGISIEGIGRDEAFPSDKRGKESLAAFKRLFGKADQFDKDPPWAWYD